MAIELEKLIWRNVQTHILHMVVKHWIIALFSVDQMFAFGFSDYIIIAWLGKVIFLFINVYYDLRLEIIICIDKQNAEVAEYDF